MPSTRFVRFEFPENAMNAMVDIVRSIGMLLTEVYESNVPNAELGS